MVESTEISVQDFIRLEPRVICDSYIAGIADLYAKEILRVHRRLPSNSSPEIYINDYPQESTTVDKVHNPLTRAARQLSTVDDELRATLRKLSLTGITDTAARSYHPTPEPTTTTETPPNGNRYTNPPSIPTQRTIGKMVNVSIKDFTGSKDGSEDYEEFLDDIEFALDQMEEYQRTDKNRLRFFRQHLKGGAAKWWNLDIPHTEKKDWKETIKAFTNKYGEGVQVEKKKWQIQKETAALSQHEGESIASYVHRDKVIDRKSTPEMNNQLAMSFLRGMRDIEQK
jgi:hypothetical protein